MSYLKTYELFIFEGVNDELKIIFNSDIVKKIVDFAKLIVDELNKEYKDTFNLHLQKDMSVTITRKLINGIIKGIFSISSWKITDSEWVLNISNVYDTWHEDSDPTLDMLENYFLEKMSPIAYLVDGWGVTIKMEDLDKLKDVEFNLKEFEIFKQTTMYNL